ncbi:hypothetical protein P4E94_16090 [Pontiellaceae bacterium B12219]|nr:hypothetical protein [Pontiellaceae bacterium B12219]
MNASNKCIVAKESGRLQIPYQDYVKLMDKVKEGKRMRLVADSVFVSLQGFLGGTKRAAAAKAGNAKASAPAKEKTESKKEAVEPLKPATKAEKAVARNMAEGLEIPPIKKDVSAHFNSQDESGRLFSVFKQYYACLNDACGGTVRVTIKDGICSLWNYNEWEEFAFIDIFEGQLRMAVDPRYTKALQSLNLCEVPRLLSSRRSLVCVQVDGLNNTMLEVLVKAFEEVGLTAG